MAIAQVRVPKQRIDEWSGFDGLVQLVSVDGQRTLGCPYWDLVADVDASQLRALYRDMAVVRRLDAEAMALQRQGELALWAPLLGQEAAQVGSARALRPDDFVFPSYREHGVAYCRGVNPVTMLRLWRGTGLSGWDPAVFGIATPAIIVGSQALHATGYALGITLDGAGSAALAYFGDGAASEGDVAEALGLAASYRVPVVFFCQNNQWAISEPAHLQSHATIAARGQGYGIPGIQVDGNDVLAVLAATRLALARAYAGAGAHPDRGRDLSHGPAHHVRRPHAATGPGPRRRSGASRTHWLGCGHCCASRAWPTSTSRRPSTRRREAAAAELRRGCLAMDDPEPAVLFDHVYAEPHPLLDEERAAYAAYLDGFDEES